MMHHAETCAVPSLHDTYDIPEALITPTFQELLWEAADQIVDDARDTYAGDPYDHLSNLTVRSTLLKVAENEHALEFIRLQVAAGTISAVYESQYKGEVGKIIRPSSGWGVSLDAGGSYYWSEDRHGGSASLFALAATDCQEITPDALPIRMMHAYLMFGLHCREGASVADQIRLTQSSYSAPNLLGKLGLQS